MRMVNWFLDMMTAYQKPSYEIRLIPPSNDKNFPKELMYDFQRAENLPRVNFNSPAWMPGFLPEMTEENRAEYEYMANILQMDFLNGPNKEKEEEEKRRGLYLSIPSKNKRYCHVCFSYFDDYINHIHSEEHLNNLRTDPGVAQFCAESEGSLENFLQDLKKELAAETSLNPPIQAEEEKSFSGDKSLPNDQALQYLPQSSFPNLQSNLDDSRNATDVEPQRESGRRESRSRMKRHYPVFTRTEDDNKVLNSMKKVKITDDENLGQ